MQLFDNLVLGLWCSHGAFLFFSVALLPSAPRRVRLRIAAVRRRVAFDSLRSSKLPVQKKAVDCALCSQCVNSLFLSSAVSSSARKTASLFLRARLRLSCPMEFAESCQCCTILYNTTPMICFNTSELNRNFVS